MYDAIVFQHDSRVSHERLSNGDTPRKSGILANLCRLDIFWKILTFSLRGCSNVNTW